MGESHSGYHEKVQISKAEGVSISRYPNFPEDNEDSFAYDPSGRWAIVADGLGGSDDAKGASQLAVDTVSTFLSQCKDAFSSPQLMNNLSRVFHETHRAILDELPDSATTCVATILLPGNGSNKRLMIAHVGDSRAYIFRSGKLTLLTRDEYLDEEHTVGLDHLAEADTIFTSDETPYSSKTAQLVLHARTAHRHPFYPRHMGNFSYGSTPDFRVNISVHELVRSDQVILATDGATDPHPRPILAEYLKQGYDLADIIAAGHEVSNHVNDTFRPGIARPDDATLVRIRT